MPVAAVLLQSAEIRDRWEWGALEIVALVLGAIVVLATALSLLRHKAWWIRIWDFPRLQVALLGLVALGLWARSTPWAGAGSAWRLAFGAVLGLAVLFQAALVWRYTRLAPCEVQAAGPDAHAGGQLSLVVSNVLQTNRQADRLLEVVRAADPDVVLAVETDAWWASRLDALLATHPETVRCPLDNTYGMLLYSRLPLERTRIDFLIKDDIPSIQALVRLRDGQVVWLNCIHPRPPAPAESEESLERDAELLLVGQRVRGARGPVVVCGDLNDVAWSRTTRLFQKVSGLLDPRKGRGFFSTFHARLPGLRYPLDHVFHSAHFRLVGLRRLPYAGSDHFPVHVRLSLEPPAAAEQEAPEADADDLHEARETVAEAEREVG
jgi:endonuclease/exonuclease/phosphatase (EEP) superfamily protein YafD